MNQQESKKLQNTLLKNFKKHLSSGDTVILGFSGGPDSVFLLHLLKHLDIKIIVAHVNHSIRKESDAEEKWCKETALATLFSKKELLSNTTFHSKKVNIIQLSKKNKKGLEETGREIRYNFFKKLKNKYNAKFIITAHHADDNLETVILNFTRGAGLRGLSGMPEKTENPELPLFRPLLTTSKKQILEFLKFNKIDFKTDKSNSDIKFKRNFIRHEIIPKLKKINPSLTETIAKNNTELREINNFVTELSRTKLRQKTKSETIDLDAKTFRKNHIALQKAILMEAHEKITNHTLNISNVHLNEVTQMINKNIGNKSKKLGEITVIIKKNTIRLKKSIKKYSIKKTN